VRPGQQIGGGLVKIFKLAAVVMVAVSAAFVIVAVAPESAAELAGNGWSDAGLVTDATMLSIWALGHCDTLDGPLIKLARKALESGNVNFVLPWVREKDEGEIKQAFQHATFVRKLGAQARELADHHFLETLVRIHRAGEGAPYTGLKPAGADLGPMIPTADNAVVDGSIETVIDMLTHAIRDGVNQHFHAVWEARKFDVDDLAAGRSYVEAYVSYIHYVERLWQDAIGAAQGHYPASEEEAQPAHHTHVH
jgi:hypothetical protein